MKRRSLRVQWNTCLRQAGGLLGVGGSAKIRQIGLCRNKNIVTVTEAEEICDLGVLTLPR